MKHLNEFATYKHLEPEQEKFLDQFVNGDWSLHPTTGLVDVNGDVDFNGKSISKIPVSFGFVSGNFKCYANRLRTLDGSPREVGGDFDAFSNPLKSLKNAPLVVGGSFKCSFTNIVNLQGSPREIGGSFNCKYCYVSSLEGGPKVVGGDFSCDNNQLTSLKDAPEVVGKNFICSVNPLKSLEGAPQKIGAYFLKEPIWIQSWSFGGWLESYFEVGTQRGRKLISTLFTPAYFEREFKTSPEKAIMGLKKIWRLDDFKGIVKKIKVPPHLQKELEVLSDLNDLGF